MPSRRINCGLLMMFLAGRVVVAQGPGSCGFHLDIRADLKSTHSAVADIPNAPGAIVGYPTGTQGNPYDACATPGTSMSMTINGNSLAYGPSPLGPGSCLTLFWSVAAPMTPIPSGTPVVGTCGGGPLIIGILPFNGTVMDSCGLGGGPPFGVFDSGSGRFTLSGTYPLAGLPPITMQAAGITPSGAIWVTNAVTLYGYSFPWEPPPVSPPFSPCGAPGYALQPVPILFPFSFYGFPVVGTLALDENGFANIAQIPFCDSTGEAGDFGCPVATATAMPRIDVNHANYDPTIPIAPPFAQASMTYEYRPAGPYWPEAMIYRWKNMPLATASPGVAGLSTAALALELHGPACFGCFPPVNDRIVIVRSSPIVAEQCGIGPGTAFQGFGGGPPGGPTCALVPSGLSFMSTFAPPVGMPYVALPGGAVIHMDSAAGSAAVLNSAIVFTPIPGFPPLSYSVVVY